MNDISNNTLIRSKLARF